MMPISAEELLRSRLRSPQHVVHRDFAAETVVLNLKTGMYHGLNLAAARMFETVIESPTVADVVPVIAGTFRQDPTTVQADLIVLCGDLLERGLLEVAVDVPG